MPDPEVVADVAAASSPAAAAPTAIDPSEALSALSPEERQTWRKTGALPKDKFATKPADSSPAAPVQDPAASTDASPEAVSETDPDYKPKTAKRIQELLDGQAREKDRADRLDRELAAARQPKPDARPAASSPAADAPTKPDPATFTYGTADPDYLEALTDFKVAVTLQAERQKAADAQQATARADDATRIQQAWQTRIEAATAKYPDFKAVALDARTEIVPGSLIDGWIWEAKAGADVLYHLQKTPAELRRIAALPVMDQIEALVLLGQTLTTAAPVKTVTSAPDPAPVLGSRAGAGADAVTTAIRTHNVGDYIREQNARALASTSRKSA